YLVCADTCWEPRQPQDFVRAKVDKQRTPPHLTRPDDQQDFVDTTLTYDVAVTDTQVFLASRTNVAEGTSLDIEVDRVAQVASQVTGDNVDADTQARHSTYVKTLLYPISTLNNGGSAITIAKDVATKTDPDGWDGDVYSTESYADGVYCAFRPGLNGATNRFMMGFSENPTAGQNFTDTNYVIYHRGTDWRVYEDGAQVKIVTETTGVETLYEIIYDGADIFFYANGVLGHTITGLGSKTYFLDSSVYDSGCVIQNIRFGAYPATGNTEGVTINDL
ncbi:MAG: hypothetical protein ACXABY_10070, partial [Candidatus Thorarchaeota archaeon]